MKFLFKSKKFSFSAIMSRFVLAIFIAGLTIKPAHAQDLDVPYVPTPQVVVEEMLDLVDIEEHDYVVDLGSGDGRIVIAAAQRGAIGHGIDIDPQRISEAREKAVENDVDDEVLFIEGDLFETDFSEASVITTYLLPSINEDLRPVILNESQPGTRVVSHSFDMGDWEPDETAEIEVEETGRTHKVFFWIVPAQIDGDWTWEIDGQSFTMNIEQHFQNIEVEVTNQEETSFSVEKEVLTGDRITVQISSGDQLYNFSGRVDDGEIIGTMQHHQGDDKTYSTWSATKK